MIKRKITETIEEFDENGKLTTKTTRVEDETDDNDYSTRCSTSVPYFSPIVTCDVVVE